MALPVQCLSPVSISAADHVPRPASVLRELLSPGDGDYIGVDQAACEPRFCKARGDWGGVLVLHGRLPGGGGSCAPGKVESSFQEEETAHAKAPSSICGVR